MKRVLFLDFDGVLHPTSGYISSPFVHADSLATCLQPHDCSVVISSSWRFQYSLQELKTMLPSELSQRVMGATGAPHIGRYARYREILHYLECNYLREQISWRTLDDCAWEFPSNLKQLILCNPNEGSGPRQFDELRRWLHGRC